MLHCFVSLYSLTSYKKKIFIAAAGRKCYSFNNTQFSVFIGDCMPRYYIPCACM